MPVKLALGSDRRWTIVMVSMAALAVAIAGCGGARTADSDAGDAQPLSVALARLPDDPDLHQHVLVSDLARLRKAYPQRSELQEALVGVWLPDALVGASGSLWRRAVGLRLDEVTSFASAGFHPAEVAVVLGKFSSSAMHSALRRSGYQEHDGVLSHGEDGSFDITTDAGRLALSALNRVVVEPERVIAASTSKLAEAADSPPRTLAGHAEFAALAAALDPITSAIVLDASLVRPPSGVPVRVLPAHPARLVGVGMDDAGSAGRTLKIALVYGDPSQARADAPLIERNLEETQPAGEPGRRFSDIATGWSVQTVDRAIVLTGRLRFGVSSAIWRELVERGDVAPFVRPAG